ncbi:Lipid droplet-associated hydrolase [Pseudolycoriella hygida]|uniref:Lipid droplet-associated hydrolase n=1 Tax=Pseudolycoriella hygida TaxID=35572 RepID=A0A9Q0MJ51_9DIPT|nr:Lipid droplet-associated hydrolase [Pseudolycoriella hygida]
MSWGPWIEDSFSKKEVIICIPGNPGLPGFYAEFMKTIHKNINPNIPVWLIGQAGHDEPPEDSLHEIPPLKGNEDLYDLDAQLEFIHMFVPSDVKIHLIGHSIGAWMIIEMLKKEPSLRHKIQHSYLLFPTIERMAASPNGSFFTKVTQRLAPVIIALFNEFPRFILSPLLSLFFWMKSIPSSILDTTLMFARGTILKKVFFLAGEEMKRVVELDSETLEILRSNHRNLTFLYGDRDLWTPSKYWEELEEKIPEIDLIVTHFEHAFILKSSVEMGKLLAEWIERGTGY